MKHKFQEGDRVCRYVDGAIKHGTVVKVNQSYRNHLNEYLILYEVQWDDGKLEKGYMDVANGLISETTKLD